MNVGNPGSGFNAPINAMPHHPQCGCSTGFTGGFNKNFRPRGGATEIGWGFITRMRINVVASCYIVC